MKPFRFPGRGNKYRNKPVRVLPNGLVIAHVDGQPDQLGKYFRSKKEAERYSYLLYRYERHEITHLQCQVRYTLKMVSPVTGRMIDFGSYVSDFSYQEHGRLVVEDSKGVVTDEFKLKKQLMALIYGIDILVTR